VTVIASLALVQGFLGALVGLLWLQVVSIFAQEGGGISSLIVMLAEVRGWALIVLSLLYFLFAVGAWQTRAWAWWVGLLVPVLTILFLFGVLLWGGSIVLVLVWLIIPIIMIWYLLTPQGRQAFGR
jgi:hypothetical protein